MCVYMYVCIYIYIYILYPYIYIYIYTYGVVNVLDCDIGISDFDLQPHDYVHFRLIDLEKILTPLSYNEDGFIIR